jgi:hypothetical protein
LFFSDFSENGMRIIFLSLVFLSFALVGCKSSSGHNQQVGNHASTYQVKSEFPSYLVGAWEANKFNWQLVFDPNGQITWLRNSLGIPMKVAEGGAYEEGEQKSSSGQSVNAAYVLGPVDAYYFAPTRDLNVRIDLSYFRMEIPQGTMEGQITDYLMGRISDDHATWNVNWLNYSVLAGADLPDTTDNFPTQLIFHKISN